MLLMSYLRIYCQIRGHEHISPGFSSENFMVLVLMYRSLIHFVLIFVYGVR